VGLGEPGCLVLAGGDPGGKLISTWLNPFEADTLRRFVH
jgi:hypothetical protein